MQIDQSCDPNCLECDADNYCLDCKQGFTRSNDWFYCHRDAICSEVVENCNQCDSNLKCTSCEVEDGYYLDTFRNRCQRCNEACKTCFGPERENCLSCPEPFELRGRECVTDCKTVVVNCKICKDKNSTSCKICQKGHVLEEGKNTCQRCPPKCYDCFYRGSNLICREFGEDFLDIFGIPYVKGTKINFLLYPYLI